MVAGSNPVAETNFGDVPERFIGAVSKTDGRHNRHAGIVGRMAYSNPAISASFGIVPERLMGSVWKTDGRETGTGVRISPIPPICTSKRSRPNGEALVS